METTVYFMLLTDLIDGVERASRAVHNVKIYETAKPPVWSLARI